MAWEADQPVLWIAARDIGSKAQNAAAKPVANRFRRVDFSNPNLITETVFGGWPKQNQPSPAVIAQMSAYMDVPADGEESSGREIRAVPIHLIRRDLKHEKPVIRHVFV